MDAVGRSFGKTSWHVSRDVQNFFMLCRHVFYSYLLYKVARVSTLPDTCKTRVVISLLAMGSLTIYLLNTRYLRRKSIPNYPSNRILAMMKTIVQGTGSVGECRRTMYRHFRANGDHFFSVPVYMSTDEEFSREILTTNFEHFRRPSTLFTVTHDPLSDHMLTLETKSDNLIKKFRLSKLERKWENLTEKLNSFCFANNMDTFFKISLRSAKELTLVMDKLAVSKTVFDLRDLVDRYTIDVIGNCALDLQCNALRDMGSDYKQYRQLSSSFMNYRSIGTIPQDIFEFLSDVIRKEVDLREAFNLSKCDFLHSLLQLKNRGDLFPGDDFLFPTCHRHEYDRNTAVTFTFNDLLTQLYLFFFTVSEIISNTMKFCLYEISVNPVIQRKLKREITRKMKETEGKLSLNDFTATNMPYLHAVVKETLRKYPPVPVLLRTCTKDYIDPRTDQTVPEGTQVMIPVRGLSDRHLHNDPDKFDPARFLSINLDGPIKSFGLGERECLGREFGLMEAKLGLIYCLNEHGVDFESGTLQPPLKVDPDKKVIVGVEGDIFLKSFRSNN